MALCDGSVRLMNFSIDLRDPLPPWQPKRRRGDRREEASLDCSVGQANRCSDGASVAATSLAWATNAEPRLFGLRSPTGSLRDLDPPITVSSAWL